ncbi:MAG: fibronectin type III domain-containing protein [PVC group bacterium]|nr:fibronectin type III domain-containing protein [PVC group bacterium]
MRQISSFIITSLMVLCIAGNVYSANQMTADVYSFTIVDDLIAPLAVSDLAISDSTHNSATLSWTAPGDDGSTGTATSYDLRYSTSVINEGNWASATQVSGEPTPSIAGSNESMTVNGLLAETAYYFAIKTSDEESNISSISNIPNVTTSAVPDTTPPYTTGHSPAKNATGVARDTDIVVHVLDDGAGVDINTIIMKVNGTTVTPTITGTSADYTLTYAPPADFDNEEVVNISVEASDLAI